MVADPIEKKINVLILNGDVPVFPGRAGHEYLNTIGLLPLAGRVGLVSSVHNEEQKQKLPSLDKPGMDLYLWEDIQTPVAKTGAQAPAAAKRSPNLYKFLADTFLSLLNIVRRRPPDTEFRKHQFRNFAGKLCQALSGGDWQSVVVVQSSCAHWLDCLPRPPVSVLVMHDVRTLLYERQASVAANWREKWSCLLHVWCYRRWERHYANRYDLIVTVSSRDEDFVRRHLNPRRVVTIPIPVDRSYFAPLPAEQEVPDRIVFTGMMNHPPNTDAACFFAREVFPLILKERPQAQFWIVGREPPSEVQALADGQKIFVTGYVDDIRPHMAAAAVVVVPLRYGSGMRNKILEAWSMDKCVVSTTIGAEGLDYVDGSNILICDEAHAMAKTVVKVLGDPSLRSRIKLQGRMLVEYQHDPQRLAQKYYAAMAAVLKEKDQRPMRVAVDLRWMIPGLAGGIENLTRSFLNVLTRLDYQNSYKLIIPHQVKYDLDLRQHRNFHLLVEQGLRWSLRRAWRRYSRIGRSLIGVPSSENSETDKLRDMRLLDAEVGLSVPGYIHPEFYHLNNVLIVPDIQHEYFPEFFDPADLEERRRLYREGIKMAKHICAISEFTRQTLIGKLNVPPEKITTTPLAADPMFHPGSPYRGQTLQVLKKYSLTPGHYLFFPGHSWPHKNHCTAIAALRILHDHYGRETILVCTGGERQAHPELVKAIEDLSLERHVRFLGYCPATDMPALYEGATALVYPSLFEGFGIPVLEAMWCGCPVVCSNTTSLPEIAGNAACLVDPSSPQEIAAAIDKVIANRDLRETLVARGYAQASTFSWERFTMQIVKIMYRTREQYYRRVI